MYHTGNTKWTSPSTYASSFETQDEHLSNFVSKCHSSDRFDLVSLQSNDSDALIDAENPQLSLFEYFMKNIHDSNLLASWQYLSSKLDKFKHVEPELLMRAICYCAKGLDLKNNIEELKNLFYNESEEDNGEIVMTSLQSMIEEGEENAAKKSRIEGEARGEAKGISVTLKYAPDANLQEDFHITQEQENKIKQLPQPPKSEDILKILLDDPTIQDLSTELSGVSDTQHAADEE